MTDAASQIIEPQWLDLQCQFYSCKINKHVSSHHHHHHTNQPSYLKLRQIAYADHCCYLEIFWKVLKSLYWVTFVYWQWGIEWGLHCISVGYGILECSMMFWLKILTIIFVNIDSCLLSIAMDFLFIHDFFLIF